MYASMLYVFSASTLLEKCWWSGQETLNFRILHIDVSFCYLKQAAVIPIRTCSLDINHSGCACWPLAGASVVLQAI